MTITHLFLVAWVATFLGENLKSSHHVDRNFHRTEWSVSRNFEMILRQKNMKWTKEWHIEGTSSEWFLSNALIDLRKIAHYAPLISEWYRSNDMVTTGASHIINFLPWFQLPLLPLQQWEESWYTRSRLYPCHHVSLAFPRSPRFPS